MVIGVIGGAIILAWGTFYAIIFASVPGGMILRILIGLLTTGVLVAFAVVVMRRVQEIREENPDDYRKY